MHLDVSSVPSTIDRQVADWGQALLHPLGEHLCPELSVPLPLGVAKFDQTINNQSTGFPVWERAGCPSQGSSEDMQTFAIASAYSHLFPSVNNSTDILSVFDK